MSTPTQEQLASAFKESDKKHILQITNHGIHQWKVIPGLPDTGGQNVFVNQFTDELVRTGYKVTIVNRGGYAHPETGEPHTGVNYGDEARRILYLEDGTPEFVRKEDMHEHLDALTAFLRDRLDEESLKVDLIISHYWDAACIGAAYNRMLPAKLTHVWVPHSVGTLKKSNMNPDTWGDLRIDERIAAEKQVMPELDGVGATSAKIREALERDYGVTDPLFLPPCIDTERYSPRKPADDAPVWGFIAAACGRGADDVRGEVIVTEISRTDTTKRKDVLIKAFAKMRAETGRGLLVVSIDDRKEPLAGELRGLIASEGVQGHVAVVGSVWDILPDLYGATSIYCTPSVMEGFGMSAQEAAATRKPVVASDLVPYAVEYLLGDDPKEENGMRVGKGCVICPNDDVDAFAAALTKLAQDGLLRRTMGDMAYRITIPYFSWRDMAARFLDAVNFK